MSLNLSQSLKRRKKKRKMNGSKKRMKFRSSFESLTLLYLEVRTLSILWWRAETLISTALRKITTT